MTAVARCSACRAAIRWFVTEAKRARMPLDYDQHPDGNVVLVNGPDCNGHGERLARVLGPLELLALDEDTPRFMPHHATCTEWAKR